MNYWKYQSVHMTQSTCTCAQNILRLTAFSFVSSNLDQHAVKNALWKTASTRVIEVLVIAGIVGVQRTHIRRVPCLEAKRREKFHCFCGKCEHHWTSISDGHFYNTLPIADTLQKKKSLLVSRYSHWYQKTKGLKHPFKIDLEYMYPTEDFQEYCKQLPLQMFDPSRQEKIICSMKGLEGLRLSSE